MEKVKKVSILIPVFNEQATLSILYKKVMAVSLGPLQKEIIIVDDHSTDGTREQLQSLNGSPSTKIFYHEKNLGKGAALRTACKEATGDILIIQDADLEYSPEEYPKLIEPILEGKADVVYGSRMLSAPHRVLLFWHYLGNKFLTLLTNVVCDMNLSDMETCYKLFKREVLQEVQWKSNRFGFEPEFTVKVAKKGFRIFEVPISYNGRSYAEGKKITWKDGAKAVFTILWFRLFD
ncbi:MAG: glycosyl transferase [Deltaproteobacteria bacterium RIFCSPLOWO2_01_44_7]|nr:MAG: glycosyl transferase [Deltaproteobacteria bacterium RIFCSPHIGHO2_01_FULL_43_49]OGQ15044.1 MAG: glycosyl transferase [Deltaproteobacteria bacterium RIFCSPHIGHO2_02_FULL_44_53]OGQ27337.1 MAG: glycosyl transferase [Deltaproteobacteria bacterium RIFCSPHIGHO2_12_FULL_44_21]OGQ31561.1 MAG: glycosyl transferase [Deltaproteobacteria bacterium RIFCSPLOWO2_01_FULL_45_74]OGQ42628.1 MAG: glycosyl transferase [Deltaproteobacteria bacterium RIFCSPLOWO2_01_44_7]OGQ42762.1 MAG: glycosyl transferase [D